MEHKGTSDSVCDLSFDVVDSSDVRKSGKWHTSPGIRRAPMPIRKSSSDASRSGSAVPWYMKGGGMGTETGFVRDVKLTLRLTASEHDAIRDAAKLKGYKTPSAFIRAAIRNEMDGRAEWTDFEQRLCTGVDRTHEEIVRLARGQQVVMALLDALTKTVLTCIPEPPLDARNQAVARARERYDRLVKSAGRAMAGDGHTAIQELVNHAAAQG